METDVKEVFSGLDEWPVITDRLNIHRKMPKELSIATGMAEQSILRGIRYADMPVALGFLRDCVRFFGVLTRVSGRSDDEVINHLDHDDCMAFLKRQPAMPPLPGNWWEREG